MASILSIDIGTSRVKTALIDECGNLLHLASERIDRTKSPDTQSAEEWYLSAVECIRELFRNRDKNLSAPDLIALTGNMHALLGVDSQGKPVADAELWCSNTAREESDFLMQHYGRILLERTGNPATPVFTLPKLLRMKKLHPERYHKTQFFLQVKDYIAYCLCGNPATDASDASGTLLYRLDKGVWDQDLAQDLQIDMQKFPTVLPSASICGYLTRKAAAETTLPAGIPVVIGSGDLASAAMGAGTDKKTLSLTLGTAGQLLALGDPGQYPLLQGKLFAFAHADPATELYLGSVPGGGFSFEWLANNMLCCSMDHFFELALNSKLSAGELPVFLPYLLGRGAPYMDYIPDAQWLGISARHQKEDLAAGAVFGVLSALRQSCDLLEQMLNQNTDSIVLQSLANRECAVQQAACDLFIQKYKKIPVNPEASLLGAAMIGAVAAGIHKDFAAARQKMVHTRDLPVSSAGKKQEALRYYQNFSKAAAAYCPREK